MSGIGDDELFNLAESALERLRNLGAKLSTAESCTGGLIAGYLTAVPGSSDVLDRGFVTYSNEAKVEMLGVDAAMIDEHGAVSAPVAKAMAYGALAHSNAQISVSVTGVAGPGQSERKPAGLVFIGIAARDDKEDKPRVVVIENRFTGDRQDVRAESVKKALEMVLEA